MRCTFQVSLRVPLPWLISVGMYFVFCKRITSLTFILFRYLNSMCAKRIYEHFVNYVNKLSLQPSSCLLTKASVHVNHCFIQDVFQDILSNFCFFEQPPCSIQIDSDWQGCHVSGKCQGKTKFSPGQGKVREFWKNVREFWPFDPCEGIVREFCHIKSGNFVMTFFLDWNFHHMMRDLPRLWFVYVCLENVNSRSTDYFYCWIVAF